MFAMKLRNGSGVSYLTQVDVNTAFYLTRPGAHKQ